MQAQRRRDFYISYFATDMEWAAWIEWSLEEQGYSIITPAWGISRGSSLELQIENALQIAEQVVVVLSPSYLSALAPQSKLAAAFRQGNVMLIRVQAVKVKNLPASLVPIDLFGVSEPEARERLLKGMPDRRVGPVKPPSSPKDIYSHPTESFPSPGQDIYSRPTEPLLLPGQDISSRPTGPLLPPGETIDTQLLSFMDTSAAMETVFHTQSEKPIFPSSTSPVVSETQILSASGAIGVALPGKTSLVVSETGPLSAFASSWQAQPLHNDVYTSLKSHPHVTDPRTIDQRKQVVEEVYQELIDPNTTAIALVGMAGVGKSILASLLHRYAEDQCRGGKDPFPAGVLWLSINKEVTLFHLAGDLFTAVGEPFRNFRDPSAATQAARLFDTLNRTAKPVLAILDQFENLLDTKGNVLPDKAGIGEWLAVLNSSGCRCKVLFTSRPLLQLNAPLTYLKKRLIDGLDEAEGVELLRKLLKYQGVLASDADLLKAVQRCQGHSFALALLATAYLNYRSRNQNPQNLAQFLDDPINARLWGEDIAEKLLNYIYTNQLSPEQQKLLLAFSVYREPVLVEAAAAILEGEVDMGAIVRAFSVLHAQHLIQARAGNAHQLHAIVAEYARNRFPDQQALQAAHARAARYYQRLPRKRGEIHSLVEAIWHYCQAGQWAEAYYGLLGQQSIYANLQRYAGNQTLLELFLMLLPLNKWRVGAFLDGARIYRTLGDLYNALGQKWDARDAYEEALNRFRNIREPGEEAETRKLLGEVYSDLGEKQTAQRFFEEALSIFRKVGNREGGMPQVFAKGYPEKRKDDKMHPC